MKKLIKKNVLFLALATLAFTACKKSDTAQLDSSKAISLNGAVAVAASQSIVGSVKLSTDSVYAIGACAKDHQRTSVTATNLPAAITTYLTTNYAGYTFIKAFSTALTTASTTKDSYVVAIIFNNKPVAIKFAADGTFKAVLELREGNDMREDRDHHVGGCFENRNAAHRDSLALSALATTIKTYMTTTYPKDTLKSAWLSKDGSIVLLSKNVTYFSNVFTITGTFVVRNSIASKLGKEAQVAQTALPAAVLTYLTATYPNYVFEKAFSASSGTTAKGYLVVIDANLTKYAIVFDGAGVFVSARSIR
jgi:hypothetical protein